MPAEALLLKIQDDYAIQEYNQNSYAFINNYRFHELERIIHENKLKFRTSLFDEQTYPDSTYIPFLSILRTIIRLTYLVQVALSIIGNTLLIRRYGSKAEQFYSDVNDGKFNNAKMLNYAILIMSLGSFTLTVLGRHFLLSKDLIICMGWSVFTSMLFIIGYLGIKQKPINPTFDLQSINTVDKTLDLSNATQKYILHKLELEFGKKKIYLNSQLNISDVVEAVGTNRT